MEIYVDTWKDFIEAKDYLGPDKSSAIITNLENFIVELLRNKEEVTITFKKLED